MRTRARGTRGLRNNRGQIGQGSLGGKTSTETREGEQNGH